MFLKIQLCTAVEVHLWLPDWQAALQVHDFLLYSLKLKVTTPQSPLKTTDAQIMHQHKSMLGFSLGHA
jgi:hypothetical protein